MDYSKQGKTSVKVHHGNQSHNVPKQSNNTPLNDPVTSTTGKASVKIHNPPGGRSNIQFG